MIEFLQEWLHHRAGAAPVWATLVGDSSGTEFIMRAVDKTGVVLAMPSRPDGGAAFPWTAITSVTPNRAK